MRTRIFKISTAEMWTMHNKKELIHFIETETNTYVPDKLCIEQLIKYLPADNYCWIK